MKDLLSSEALAEIKNMYEGSTPHKSIIFDINGSLFMSILSNDIFFIGAKVKFYENILIGIKRVEELRYSDNSRIIIKNQRIGTLFIEKNNIKYKIYARTNNIIELKKMLIQEVNTKFLYNYFFDKDISTKELYSMIVNKTFEENYLNIMQEPTLIYKD